MWLKYISGIPSEWRHIFYLYPIWLILWFYLWCHIDFSYFQWAPSFTIWSNPFIYIYIYIYITLIFYHAHICTNYYFSPHLYPAMRDNFCIYFILSKDKRWGRASVVCIFSWWAIRRLMLYFFCYFDIRDALQRVNSMVWLPC